MNQLTPRQQDMLSGGRAAFAAAARARRLRRAASTVTAIALAGAVVAVASLRLAGAPDHGLPAHVELIDGDAQLIHELELASACERIERTDGRLHVLDAGCLAIGPAR